MLPVFGSRQCSKVLTALFVLPALFVWGQKPPSSPAPTSIGSNPGTTSGNLGTNGTTNSNRTTNFPNSTNQGGTRNQTPIFLSGRVLFDDGTQPDRDVRIERVCAGAPHLEGHTDSKGRFSLQLGQSAAYDFDASDSSFGAANGRSTTGTSAGNFGNNTNATGYGDRGSVNLSNCELRASYPGYRSDFIELGTRRALDSPDVGTIVLHHLGNVQGTTISLTTAMAPKDARKDYEKGMQLAEKGKIDEAMRRFANATDIYPKYAVAWYALGQIQQKQGHATDARLAYEKAFAADARYVSPLNQLALLAAQDGKWEDAADFSKQAISLNPVEFPSAFWYNALANYNLKKAGDSEKSAKDLLKLDTQHHFPEAENLMAQLLLDSGKYPEAAAHLRSYLTLVPNAKNADTLKQILLKIDAAQATAPPTLPAAGKP